MVLFDRKTPFLAQTKLRITNIKLKIAIKLKNDGFMVIFRLFGAKHWILSHFFARVGGLHSDFRQGWVLPKSDTTPKTTPV